MLVEQSDYYFVFTLYMVNVQLMNYSAHGLIRQHPPVYEQTARSPSSHNHGCCAIY